MNLPKNAKYLPRDHIPAAILFMFGAMFLFTTANTFVKKLGGLQISPLQIVFFRNLIPLLCVGGYFALKTPKSLIITKEVVRDFGFRSLFSTVGLSSLFFAYMQGNLSDVTSISFTSPLFVSLLAVPLLREHLTRDKVIGLLVGFSGAVIVTRPSGEIDLFPALFAFLYAGSAAYLMVTDRRLRHHYNSVEILFYFSCGCALFSFFPMLWLWYSPLLEEWGLLLVIGVLGGFAQLCIAMAYRRAAAAVVAPVAYISVVIAAVYNYVLFEVSPTIHLVLGSVLIAGGGGYIILHEKKRQKKKNLPS